MPDWFRRILVIAASAVSAIAIATAVIASAATQTGRPRFLVRVEPGNWVTLLDPTTGATRRIYHSEAAAITGLSIAPRQDRLTFIEVFASGDPRKALPHEFIIIDSTGKLVSRIQRDVRTYTWCGDDCIAYIVGENYEGGLGFIPHGVFRLDLRGGTETAIELVPPPYALTWVPLDTSLYFKGFSRWNGASVVRYGLLNRSLSPTSYKDFRFSPSGRHYIERPDEGWDTTRVYETATNHRVSLPESPILGEPGGWVFGHGDYLLFGRRLPPLHVTPGEGIRRGVPGPVEYRIYDVSARRVVRKLPGEVAAWAAPRGFLPIVVEGRVVVLSKP
ncbi:MAG: hypothetical protein Q8Q14_12115 [Gemmatimonadales bacterium]|nr:hypothetical protein [Gemmatimonadales bacterium]